MHIFHDLKLIYIRVPKTGSSSFFVSMSRTHKVELVQIGARSLYPPFTTTQGHYGAEMTRTLIDPEIWDSYEKIGFIRHPYPWVVSFYNQPNTDEMFREDNRKPLGEFIWNLKLTPFSWCTDSDGEMLIDTVYRMEDLSTVMD